VLFPLSNALYLDSTTVAMNFFMLPILALWCANTLGMRLAKSDLWSPDLTLHPITAVRPISTGGVVLAKLKVAAIVSLLGFALFVPLAVPAMQLARGLAYLNEEVLQFWPAFPTQHRTLMHWAANPIVIFTAFGLTWSTMVNGMCPALAGRMRRNIWVVGRQLTLFGIVVLIADWLYVHQEHLAAFLQLLPWVTGGALLWKWTAAARAFRQARGEGYYSRKQWWGLAGAWLLLTCGVGTSGFLAYAAHQIPVPIIFFLAVCLLPGGALARCAANLAENRHR